MPSTNFHIAPPAKTVDGLLAVPMDIQTTDASFVFDGLSQTVVGDATITYTVGPTAGYPIFDLRQTPTAAWVDGASFPISQLASHDFGAGTFSELRILESWQAAGSVHSLRIQYQMALPASQLTGAYPPRLDWSPGPKLRFAFGLSDLNAGRYTEAFLPSNLIFDQFALTLDIQIINTLASHSVITNGTVTAMGSNHWSIAFPDRFTALSPLLEIRASDALVFQSDTVSLPVSGATVAIEAWQLVGGSADLTAQINLIKSHLIENENAYGPYHHGARFVAFFNGGGMEYEGGTTTDPSALRHETFHSWFARGVKPASQADGWWDEAYTTYHDHGAVDAIAFDYTSSPIQLCSRNPWQRRTPGNSYGDGERFWKGMASLLGAATVNSLMADFYCAFRGQPVSTEMMEGFLLSKSGQSGVVDAFHRFIYGFPDASPPPELWIKDDAADPGSDYWGGTFWDSPDLWIRNTDDDGLVHQSPEYGQDNWFYARVRNKSASGACQHFAITFHSKEYAGTEFVYPGDFLPCITAKAEFNLAAGDVRIVKALWPRSRIPLPGTHACLLASVQARQDHPASGLHVWEHNNLAQKNLTIVDLQPNEFIIIPVVLTTLAEAIRTRYHLEIRRDPEIAVYATGLVTQGKNAFPGFKGGVERLKPRLQPHADREEMDLDCGGHGEFRPAAQPPLMTSAHPERIAQLFPDPHLAFFPPGKKSRISMDLLRNSQRLIGLKIEVPPRAKKGTRFKTHLVQRDAATGKITGGIAVEIRVV